MIGAKLLTHMFTSLRSRTNGSERRIRHFVHVGLLVKMGGTILVKQLAILMLKAGMADRR